VVTPTTNFLPLYIIAHITNQFDFIPVIHRQKLSLRINGSLYDNVSMKISVEVAIMMFSVHLLGS